MGIRMTSELRDHFAAAALTGLLEPDDVTSDTDWWKAQLCRKAYEWADAMLRERTAHQIAESATECSPDHDAAPAARARTDAESDRADQAASRICKGTGDTPDTRPIANCDTAEPAAWGVRRVGGAWVTILANEVQAETSRRSFDKRENWVHEVVPLYRQPRECTFRVSRNAKATLTAKELMALEDCLEWAMTADHRSLAAILRGLLERLGVER